MSLDASRSGFRPSRFLLVLLLSTTALVAARGEAWAQPEEPISLFVVDARGAIPFLPHDATLAEPRETTSALMPNYGWGFDVGAHVYPIRSKIFALGVGASLHMSAGSRTPPVPDGSTAEPGPKVSTRFRAFSPQVSFNFGHRMGWSYLSGGIGRSTFRAWRDDLTEEIGEPAKTINYGGGARWFINPHLAFTLDLRLFALNPQAPTEKTAGHPRMTFAVANIGVSLR